MQEPESIKEREKLLSKGRDLRNQMKQLMVICSDFVEYTHMVQHGTGILVLSDATTVGCVISPCTH